MKASARGAAALLAALLCGCAGDAGPRPGVGRPEGAGSAGRSEAERVAAWVRDRLPVELTVAEVALILRQSPLPAVPPSPTNRVADDPRAARLGQALFFDTRLSPNGELACASCHVPELGLADRRPLGRGLGDLGRHVPHLWNVGHGRWFFWDGRADTLWAQARQPMEHPKEQGYARTDLVRLLAGDADLRAAYEAIFGALPDASDLERFPEGAKPDPFEPWHEHAVRWNGMAAEDRADVDGVLANVGKALEAYERLLVSRDSAFDRFVRGLRTQDERLLGALSDPAVRGLALFAGRGRCLTCHHGPNFSDGEFHDIRLPIPEDLARDEGRFRGIRLLKMDPFNAIGPHSDAPTGLARMKVERLSLQRETWQAYKTPTLRNVALTPPYMHLGQLATLADVVSYYSTMDGARPLGEHMEDVLVPLELSEDESADLVAFLESLTGAPLPDHLLVPPESPLLDR